MKENSIYGMTYYPAEGQMMFNVKADDDGKEFVRMIRKALNRDRYDIRVRGSLKNRRAVEELVGESISDQSVPLKYADRWRVYIEQKRFTPSPYTDTDGTMIAKLTNLNQQIEERDDLIVELKDCISNWQTYYDEREQDIKNYEDQVTKLSQIINERNVEIRKLTERVDKVSFVGLSQHDISTIKHWEGHKFIDIARYVYRQTGAKLMSLKVFKEASELGLKDSKLVCDYLVFPFENPQRNG